MCTMRSVVIALAAGLTLTGIAIIAILAHSPLSVAGTNSVSGAEYFELEQDGKLSSCQPSGTIPRGTSAIRIGVEGLYFGPAVTIKVLKGSRVLREGHQVPGGVSAPTATVPVSSFAHPVDDARVCMAVGPAKERIRYYGVPNHSAGPRANPLQQSTLHVEYMRPGGKSWWSQASSIAYHIGLGRAPSGTWVAFLALFLMLVVVAVVSRLTLEQLR